MGYIILYLTFSLLLAFAMGWLFDIAITADSDKVRIAAVVVTLLCIFVLTLDVTFLLGSAQEYYETKEYSVTEYNFNKKIITFEEDNVAKVDTVFSLPRKNKQKNK